VHCSVFGSMDGRQRGDAGGLKPAASAGDGVCCVSDSAGCRMGGDAGSSYQGEQGRESFLIFRREYCSTQAEALGYALKYLDQYAS
jgi:hypothetical protein